MAKSIDLTFLNSFTGGNQEKKKKYINMFLSYCPGQLTIMNEHLTSGNYDGLRATAHALKPQIIYMGIQGGEDLIKKIENMAGTRTEVEKLPEMLKNFTNLSEDAIKELKAEIE